MQTVDFLNAVLPQSGRRYLAIPQEKGWKHYQVANNDQLAALAKKADSQGKNVYFAVASYKDDSGRKQTNVDAVRSFWLDIDCGDDKDYPDQTEGLKALVGFLRETGLPKPMIVDSGNGLHVYWPLTEDLDEPTWKATAQLYKLACRKAEFRADPSRTADSASVLRPVGSTNRKRGNKAVKVLREGEAHAPTAIAQLLQTYLGASSIDVLPSNNRPTTKVAMNSDLSGGMEYPPSHAEPIAEQCAVMKLMRDTRGHVDQPTWYGCLGVLAFTEEGDVCHQWSDGHPNYSPQETDQKIKQARRYKPTTCNKLADAQPSLCSACPHFGKIKSPITLGFERPTPPDPEELQTFEVQSAEDPTKQVEFSMPKHFQRAMRNGGNYGIDTWIETEKEDKDGNSKKDGVWVPITDVLFYPINRIKNPQNVRADMLVAPGSIDESNSVYSLEIEMEKRPGLRSRFEIPAGVIGGEGRELFAELAKREIVARPRMKNYVSQYLSEWVSKLRREADEIRVCKHFGWYGDSFVIGRKMYLPGGIERRAIMSGNAISRADFLEPQGTLDAWVQAVNHAYNYPGQEGFQFAVLCGFAAPLFAMLRPSGGIMVYAHTEKTGKGKSTAFQTAMSAWGQPDDLSSSLKKCTVNALWGLLGTHHNLPFVYDELTGILPEDASSLAYSLSDGRQRDRMNTAGVVLDSTASWGTIMLCAGNNLFTEKLAAHRANAEAEVARVFEYTLRSEQLLTVSDANQTFETIRTNYGHAGRVFMRYVVDHKAVVDKALRATRDRFVKDAGLTAEDRYWSDLCAAVIVSLRIARMCSLLTFDENNVLSWLSDRVGDNRAARHEAASDPVEVFGRMLTELWNGILVTVGEGDARSRSSPVSHHPVGKLCGRVILENEKTHDRPYLYLSASAARDWCAKRGVSAKELFDACVREGWATPTLVRYSLGKGTAEYATQSSHINCWQLDPHKMAATSGAAAGVGNIITSVISGASGAASTGSP